MTTQKHDPFLRRRQIVLCGLFTASIAFLAEISLPSAVFVYLLAVIGFDHLFKRLKEAPIDEERLQKEEKISLSDLRRYFNSKRTYRGRAMLFATVVSCSLSMGDNRQLIFISAYILAWSVYPLIRMFILKIPAPTFRHRYKVNVFNKMQESRFNYLLRINDPYTPGTIAYRSRTHRRSNR